MRIVFLLLLSLAGQVAVGQVDSLSYDSVLARKLGADEYGMKMYVLAILKTGPSDAVITDTTKRSALFRGHLDNINRLANAGKIIVAGPLEQNDHQYRGIFILDSSLEEARDLLQSDPTIQAGIFDVELFPWYGSAALPVYLDTHRKIEKVKP